MSATVLNVSEDHMDRYEECRITMQQNIEFLWGDQRCGQ